MNNSSLERSGCKVGSRETLLPNATPAEEARNLLRSRSMRALVLDSPGKPLRLIERPRPRPGPGQVAIKVLACAVCRTDLHLVQGELPHPKLPIIPGHEIV